MKVWVTRDERPDGPLSRALRANGFEPLVIPIVSRRCIGDAREAIARLADSDWLVLTSAFAARCIAAGAVRCRVACVGEQTARAARSRGLRVDLIAKGATARGLWKQLRATVRRGAICYPRSSLARPPTGFDPRIRLIAPVVYETAPIPFDHAIAASAAAVCITSPSAAAAIAGMPGLPPCASIGPTTTRALRDAGIPVRIEASRPTFDSLARAVRLALDAAH